MKLHIGHPSLSVSDWDSRFFLVYHSFDIRIIRFHLFTDLDYRASLRIIKPLALKIIQSYEHSI